MVLCQPHLLPPHNEVPSTLQAGLLSDSKVSGVSPGRFLFCLGWSELVRNRAVRYVDGSHSQENECRASQEE